MDNTSETAELSRSKPLLRAVIKSMRLHQWVKNLLLLIPLVLTASHADLAHVLSFVAGFLFFGLLSSGTYILNDIVDMEADRRHPQKKGRPIAAGDLSAPIGAGVGLILITVAVVGAVLLSGFFAMALLAYLALTLAYSLWLKQIPLIDVLTIAALFTLRMVAGMTLVGEPPSQWLLMFSIFFFFSLALLKRDAEFSVMHRAGSKILHGRGYTSDDRILVTAFGIASGVASLVVFALFVSSMIEKPSSPYTAPVLLWGAMPALSYWIMRMWLLTGRGLMMDDPILYAVGDRASLILAGLMAAFVIAAQFVQL